jgi:glucose-6-phosphate 1-dehydrogenase
MRLSSSGTGDLAFKHIIPALQRMVQAGELKVPVVGVAREHWTAERLAERMSNSLMAWRGGARSHGAREAL